jgi:DNA polymerase III subunit gamma/tau
MATQALYRRYRPRRFAELKGQDHVVRALRDAVRSGREGQAYLFSGPRGTGKTTSARILAKVLNCENPADGEPCCACESCVAVERGTSYDVHELDAASNNGVEAIRELIERASLGTPGRHKVYILDEVHMLSRAAEAALLKTLEEPPPHVVFVLATTDPQKMSDTIRSRTQHLQFHLLPADTLAEHVRWVAADAGIDLSDDAFEFVLDQGSGSARDTLSALELMAATGGDVSERLDLDEFMQAMIDHDTGRALTATAHAVSLGREPRTLTEELVRHLRNGFLSLMAPELVQLSEHRVDQVAASAQLLGPARLVRAMERLGTAMVEMRHAPDPRILLEVALVQLTGEEAAGDVAALAARLDRLEHAVNAGLGSAGAAATARPAAPVDPATGRAVLGGRARRPATAAPTSDPASDPATATAPPPAPQRSESPTAAPTSDPTPAPQRSESPATAPTPDPTPAPQRSESSTAAPTPDPTPAPQRSESPAAAPADLDAVWNTQVRPGLKPIVRALYSAGSFTRHDADSWYFSVPNAHHGDKCDTHRAEVEQALSAAIGSPVRIVISVGGAHDPDQHPAPATAAPAHDAAGAASPSDDPDADIDLDDLTDAPPEAVLTPLDRIAQAFPGSELLDADES